MPSSSKSWTTDAYEEDSAGRVVVPEQSPAVKDECYENSTKVELGQSPGYENVWGAGPMGMLMMMVMHGYFVVVVVAEDFEDVGAGVVLTTELSRLWTYHGRKHGAVTLSLPEPEGTRRQAGTFDECARGAVLPQL